MKQLLQGVVEDGTPACLDLDLQPAVVRAGIELDEVALPVHELDAHCVGVTLRPRPTVLRVIRSRLTRWSFTTIWTLAAVSAGRAPATECDHGQPQQAQRQAPSGDGPVVSSHDSFSPLSVTLVPPP